MKVIETKIPDVTIIELAVYKDDRGFFMETWQHKHFEGLVAGSATNFVQDNQSVSLKGVLRGLHYQKENCQGKLVRVVKGDVFSVAVDIRVNSPTFGQWVGVILSGENNRMLLVPAGFAHGFYVTSETATFLYKCTDYYNPIANTTIAWNDKDIDIEWPVNVENIALSISDKLGKSLERCKEENILL